MISKSLSKIEIKSNGNTEITYTVSEDAVPDYTTSINGYEITNQHAPEALSIPVKKVWVDNENAQGLRPASVHVRLYADGTQVDEFDLNAGNNWSHIFNGLPRYTAGHEIDTPLRKTQLLTTPPLTLVLQLLSSRLPIPSKARFLFQ